MDNSNHLQSLIADIAYEHRELHRRLRELREQVHEKISANEIASKLANIAASLSKLHQQMETHFAEEEAGGVVEEAVARLPRLGAEAEVVRREHPQLLRRVDEAIRIAEATSDGIDVWEKTRTAVETFVDEMLTHEAAENRLLEQGFNQDFSTLG